MLKLSDSNWNNLSHAYGEASDIPALLTQLSEYPGQESYQSEPYFSLWSALCHQGDVYSASYAAVPHIIEFLAAHPSRATADYFMLPTCIEIARKKGNGPQIPPDLERSYFSALRQLPALVAKVTPDDEGFTRVLAAAIAVAHGEAALGEAILELSPDVLNEFEEWQDQR
jgi:hypothetical protein